MIRMEFKVLLLPGPDHDGYGNPPGVCLTEGENFNLKRTECRFKTCQLGREKEVESHVCVCVCVYNRPWVIERQLSWPS